MNIEYRKLTCKELDEFITMRINQLREEGAEEDIDLKPALYDYYNSHIIEGTFVSQLAYENDKIVGTAEFLLLKNLLILDVQMVR